MSRLEPAKTQMLVVGLVRDLEKSITARVINYDRLFSQFAETQWLVVESDSTDATVSALTSLASELSNFDFISLGALRSEYPERTARIAVCRNRYLAELRENPEYGDAALVMVLDLDGVNDGITLESLQSCLKFDSWDVCTANQEGPYYDVWALRHDLWSPNDCWAHAEFLMQHGCNRFSASWLAIYSRMIRIPIFSQWIEVKSAFGGAALYRRECIGDSVYVGLDAERREVCEHVAFHEQIRLAGGRIFINPGLINAGTVGHAHRATKLGRVGFWFYCQLAEFKKLFPLRR